MISWLEAREPLDSWAEVAMLPLPGPGMLTQCNGLSLVPIGTSRSVLINGETGGWVLTDDGDGNAALRRQGTMVDPTSDPQAAALWRRGLVRINGRGAFDGVDVGKAIENTRQRYTLVMLLSTGCNLACNYCYLGHRLPSKDAAMPREIAVKAIEGALENDWDEVMFDFGEVAVSWNSFDSLASEAVARTKAVGKRPRVAIQTNGTTVDESIAERLADLDAVVGISLDGTKSMHDGARTFRSGAGSYDRAVHAIELLRQRGVAVHLIATIGRHNVDHPVTVVEELLTHDPTSFLLKPVLAEGEAGAAWDREGVTPDRYAEFARTVVRHAGTRGPDRLDQSATKFLNRMLGDRNGWRDSCTSRYCGSGRTLHVVDPKGGTHSCPRFVDEVPSERFIRLPLTVKERPRPDLSDLLPESLRCPPTTCAGCEWLASCGGGCTLIGHDAAEPATPQPDPHCDAYDVMHRELLTQLIPAYLDGKHRQSYAFNGARVVSVGR